MVFEDKLEERIQMIRLGAQAFLPYYVNLGVLKDKEISSVLYALIGDGFFSYFQKIYK